MPQGVVQSPPTHGVVTKKADHPMPHSATLTIARRPERDVESTLAPRLGDVWRFAIVEPIRRASRRAMDRILAKFAYHDSRRYHELVVRAAGLLPEPVKLEPFVRHLRKLDPQGLGVFYLARTPRAANLTELCRRVLASPRVGPPRAVARLLNDSLDGKSIVWLLDADGLHALTVETLMGSALAALLGLAGLATEEGKPLWTAAQGVLTSAANSMQTAARAPQRAFAQDVPGTTDAVNLVFQALNVVRRAMNNTNLIADNEQLVRSVAGLVLDAIHAACAASGEFLNAPAGLCAAPDSSARCEPLFSVVRSVDALAARFAALRRGEYASRASLEKHSEQAARVLASAATALRPWGVDLRTEPFAGSADKLAELTQRSTELAEACAAMLDAWATLYSVLEIVAPRTDGPATSTAGPAVVPVWATMLRKTLTADCSREELVHAVRGLAGPIEQALPAAVCIALSRNGSREVQQSLWELIRAAESSVEERSLAFQLFWRTMPAVPARA